MVPPALRNHFRELVKDYSSGILSEDDAYIQLRQLGLDEEDVENMLWDWQNSYEDTSLDF